jgi:hypothetical protein
MTSALPSACTPRAMNGTDQFASNPRSVTVCVTGRNPPLKLGCGQSPLTDTAVALPKARIASRCAPVNFSVAVTSNFAFGWARPAARAPNKASCVSPPCRKLIVTLWRAAAGANDPTLPPAVMVASACAPRASVAPTRNSARFQSSRAPSGALAGIPERSNDALKAISD